jgi:NADPH2:quinone reductase
VISTVSSEEKAKLARAAGSDHVVDYRSDAAVDEIRRHAAEGVDLIVEVAPAANAALDLGVLSPNGTVAAYASEGGDALEASVWGLMSRNVRYQFVFVYTVPTTAKDQAVLDVSAAARDGVLSVGEAAGLPLHRFPLERTGEAHAAVEGGALGKVLIDID